VSRLNHLFEKFLNRLESRFNCHIQFVAAEKEMACVTESVFYEKGRLGIPFFIEDDFYGYFLVSSKCLTQKSFKILEVMIKENLGDFVKHFKKYLRNKHFSSLSLTSSNVIPLKKWDLYKTEPRVLLISGKTKEQVLRSALQIHNQTPHLALIHLDLLTTKDYNRLNLDCATFVVSDWMSLTSLQKQKIKNFISLSQSVPMNSVKIIIGFIGECVEWKIS